MGSVSLIVSMCFLLVGIADYFPGWVHDVEVSLFTFDCVFFVDLNYCLWVLLFCAGEFSCVYVVCLLVLWLVGSAERFEFLFWF